MSTDPSLSSSEEKIALEHQAAKLFMRAYEKLSGQKIRHIWHNKPSKPDVSCKLENEQLDLEIAHLYGSELEAMSILQRDLSEQTRLELFKQRSQRNTDQRLCLALEKILANKAGKHYDSERVWLVIRNAHPAWTAPIIAEKAPRLTMPEKHPFEQIWIIGDFEGSTGIIRLFP